MRFLLIEATLDLQSEGKEGGGSSMQGTKAVLVRVLGKSDQERENEFFKNLNVSFFRFR